MQLKPLYEVFATHPEGRWVMDPRNVESLYKFVKEHPVKKVLDLGTGIGLSSSVIALALKDKGETDYRIDSVEQYEKCVKIASRLIPPELKEHITIHQSKAVVWQTEKIPYQYFSIYESLPEGDYDLILNDGPAPVLEGEAWVDLPNGTITKLLLEEKIKAGTFIIWDGRISALTTLERYFGGNFYLAQCTKPDFNVLERKDNPIQFEDLKKQDIARNTTYFQGMEAQSLTKQSEKV